MKSPFDLNLKEIPGAFTTLYFADIVTTCISLYIWSDGNLKEVNPFMVEITNTLLTFVIFKLILYLVIIASFKYIGKYSPYADKIFTVITIVYAIIAVNNSYWLYADFTRTIAENTVNLTCEYSFDETLNLKF